MQKVTIDLSIAVQVNIGNVSFFEDLNIYFKSSENWEGTYELKIFNSHQKNIEKEVTNALKVENDLMTLRIAPSIQLISATNYYYEIWQRETNRIYFKGQLNIIK
jgi:hypothetical protein